MCKAGRKQSNRPDAFNIFNKILHKFELIDHNIPQNLLKFLVPVENLKSGMTTFKSHCNLFLGLTFIATSLAANTVRISKLTR